MDDSTKNYEETATHRLSGGQWVQTLLSFIFQLNRNKLLEHQKIIEEQNKKYNELKEKENQRYLESKRRLEKEKTEKLKQIEESTKEEINKTNKKYQEMINYLNENKGNREKLIEFFNKFIA